MNPRPKRFASAANKRAINRAKPKIKIVGPTKAQQKRAEKIVRERMAQSYSADFIRTFRRA